MRFAAWYGVLVGSSMIVQWAVALAIGGVPEVRTAPFEIGFHLAAEASTAGALIVGGATTLRGRSWGSSVLLVGLGMVIYSEIASPGYFAQRGELGLVAMFALLLAGAVVAAIGLARRT